MTDESPRPTRETLNAHYGIPKGPLAVFDRMTQLSRRTGQTTELVMGLPEDGKAIVMVRNPQNERHIRQMIADLRPGYPYKNLRFTTYERYGDDHSIRGLCLPVFVDNEAIAEGSRRFVRRMNDLFGPREDDA